MIRCWFRRKQSKWKLLEKQVDGGDRNGSSGITEGKENETGLGLINEAEGHLSGDICSLKERMDYRQRLGRVHTQMIINGKVGWEHTEEEKHHAELKKKKVFKEIKWETSLIGICLPMQGTLIQSLVWEDSTCPRATKPVCHKYWSPRALDPMFRNKRSRHHEKPAHCN